MRTIATHAGVPVREAELTSDAGARVNLLSYGGILRDWQVADRDGTWRPVTLGFDEFAPYATNRLSFGIIAGRIANRVSNARFTLDGQVYALNRNYGKHQLHGGREGLGRQHWTMEADKTTARLTLFSPDGSMGYPGNVHFTADFALDGHTLTFTFKGEPDRPTPIALAQHAYYQLGGPPEAQELMVNGGQYTEVDDEKIPTGRVLPVDGTPLDFRRPRQTGHTHLDHNFCLDGPGPAATLEGDLYRLSLSTDRPGLQVFNAYDAPTLEPLGHGGVRYGPFCGLALEAQNYPNAVNTPSFGTIIATPERPYVQHTAVTIAPKR